MKNIYDLAKSSPLFLGIEVKDLPSLLSCLSAKTETFAKGKFIFTSDSPITSVGVLLSGSISITHENYWGDRTILSSVSPFEVFGEALIYAKSQSPAISAVATEKSEVLFIDCHKVITSCSSACEFHNRLIKNMLGIIAEKNIALTQKIELLTKKTTRDKLLSFLSKEAQKANSNKFDIAFNRQELADYLAVDRSAMSYELSKLSKEGIITYKKNHFKIYQGGFRAY